MLGLTYDCTVTAFYPYTSIVKRRFLETEYEGGDGLCELQGQLVAAAIENGIKAYQDNKTVFELTNNDTGAKLYVGFKDWTFSIGCEVWTECEDRILRKE